MKNTIIIFLSFWTLTSISWAQVDQGIIDDAVEAAKWDMDCNELSCLFKRDIYHNKGDEVDIISVFIEINKKTKDIDRMVIFYPGTASVENGGFISFFRTIEKDGEFSIEGNKEFITRLPFDFCVEDGCQATVIPDENGLIKFDLKEQLLDSSHLWFLYQNEGQSVRALSSLFSFQEQYAQLP
ncbi:MAG: hypothetical protein R3D86_11990 [Emcibacteraceae bacterium]